MQFTPAGASAAHQKLGARPSGPSVKTASASGAPERARVAQSAKLMASGHRVRVWVAVSARLTDATQSNCGSTAMGAGVYVSERCLTALAVGWRAAMFGEPKPS